MLVSAILGYGLDQYMDPAEEFVVVEDSPETSLNINAPLATSDDASDKDA